MHAANYYYNEIEKSGIQAWLPFPARPRHLYFLSHAIGRPTSIYFLNLNYYSFSLIILSPIIFTVPKASKQLDKEWENGNPTPFRYHSQYYVIFGVRIVRERTCWNWENKSFSATKQREINTMILKWRNRIKLERTINYKSKK